MDAGRSPNYQPSISEALAEIYNRNQPVKTVAYDGTIDPTGDIMTGLAQDQSNATWGILGTPDPGAFWNGSAQQQPDSDALAVSPIGPIAQAAQLCHDKCWFILETYPQKGRTEAYERCLAHCMGTSEWPRLNKIVPYGAGA
ncbi:MAG: hypothetical protein HYR63_07680 [Proteobacteria bacterium]|nr:hypothetical protein [Pseudomonadota bacterium]